MALGAIDPEKEAQYKKTLDMAFEKSILFGAHV